MPALTLLIPFICIRFLLLARLNEGAIKRAAHFAPLVGNERIAYWIYQLSTLGILVYLFFLSYQTSQTLLYYLSSFVYLMGMLMLLLSTVSFAYPSYEGLNKKGIYRISRNPMYVSYSFYFIGCALLTQSLGLFLLTVIFHISQHWIILAEERWCAQTFGEEYSEYLIEVRRYV